MSSGFSIGLNALQANAGAIEVASKNIAASNVSGFKSTEFLFQEALTRSLQPSASGRFGTVGTSGVSRRNYASGSSKYSSSPLDMSITGDGFFTLGLSRNRIRKRLFLPEADNFSPTRKVLSSVRVVYSSTGSNQPATDSTLTLTLWGL
jgi:flagellar hook protein FlgE